MPDGNIQIEEEAIGWVVRLRDAGPEEWETFTAWLEADPAHAAAYEEIALADEGWGALSRRGSPVPASSRPRMRATRRAFIGGAVAAGVIGLVGYGVLAPGGSAYAVETAAGERRTVELADGSRIDLNGSTRILLDRETPRYARLERGEALFTVVHDASRPFEVLAQDVLLRDAGTVFNVLQESGLLEVGVAEGAVVFDPDRDAIDLGPGMLLRREQGARPTVTRREAEAVAGWMEGRLVYASATISRVAADLSRNLGVPVTAGAEVSGRTFTGVIMVEGDRGQALSRAALVLGVDAERSGEGWILKTGETR